MKTIAVETKVPAIIVDAEFMNDVVISKWLIMDVLNSGSIDLQPSSYNGLLSVHNFLTSLLNVGEDKTSFEQKYAPFGKEAEMPDESF